MAYTLRRIIVLLLVSLAVGLTVNQLCPGGIRWALLKPSFQAGRENSQILFISADSALIDHIQGAATFVDVRPAEEYQIDHIPGAFSIPLYEYYRSPEILERFKKSDCYIFYCFDSECDEALILAKEFIKQNFTRIDVLYGGLSAWLEKGYPLEQ